MSQTPVYTADTICPHLLTLTPINSLPVFSNPSAMYIVLDALSFLQRHGRLQLYAYVIMENHIHLLAASETLSRELEDFKSFTTGSIVSYLEARNARYLLRQLEQHRTNGTVPLWHKELRTEQIHGPEVMRQAVDYIHYNPVRRGYVDYPCHWRYSSARNYAGQSGLIEVITEWSLASERMPAFEHS